MSREPTSAPAPADEPLALFAALRDEAPGLGGADDVAEVRRAVAAMRRGHRLSAPRRRWGTADSWRRAAAVGVLALGLASLAAGGWRRTADVTEAPAAVASAGVEAVELAPAGLAPGAPAALADERERRPVFEGLDQPRSASVYELAGDGLDVVMVVDETLDV